MRLKLRGAQRSILSRDQRSGTNTSFDRCFQTHFEGIPVGFLIRRLKETHDISSRYKHEAVDEFVSFDAQTQKNIHSLKCLLLFVSSVIFFKLNKAFQRCEGKTGAVTFSNKRG